MKVSKLLNLAMVTLLCGCADIPGIPKDTSKNTTETIRKEQEFVDPINQSMDRGVIIVSKGSTSPSGTISASDNTYLGQWDLKASSENEKVSSLRVRVVIHTFLTEKTLKNVKLLLNGRQIGTAIPIMRSAAVQSITSSATDIHDATFTVGNSLIVRDRSTISVVADTTDLYEGNTVQIALVPEQGNAQGQISMALANAPASTIPANIINIE